MARVSAASGVNMDLASPPSSSAAQPASTNRLALVVVTSIFFMWGFLTCLNDILIPHLKAAFELNYARAMLIQFTFFGAYFLMSLPAGWVVGKLGYKYGIVVGLAIAGIGAALFWPAAEMHSYNVFLGALFVLVTIFLPRGIFGLLSTRVPRLRGNGAPAPRSAAQPAE